MSASNEIMDCLNKIFISETAGIIRYMHYSFMIMGHNRIPIQKWFRDQAQESMSHATIIGEKITAFGGHPPVLSAPIHETNSHNVDQLLKESMEFETQALEYYKDLLKAAMKADDIALEELARGMVQAETEHLEEVAKMLRKQ